MSRRKSIGMRPERIRTWLFRAAVAVTAAAVTDPIVERLSDCGTFGPGRFTDRSTIDVIPALCVAFGLCLLFSLLLARRILAPALRTPRWLRRYAAAIDSRSFWSTVPSVFVVQLGTLFTMETLEQIAVAGHPLGGSVWLGGPIAVSLLFHFLGAALCTWTLSRALCKCANTIALAVRLVLRVFRKPVVRAEPPRLGARFFSSCRCIEPYLRRLHGRAPPPILSF